MIYLFNTTMRFLFLFSFLIFSFATVQAQLEKQSVPNAKQLATEKAKAAKGSAEEMYKLGLYYYFGTGVVKNAATAKQWFAKATAKNNVAAMLAMSEMYAAGVGVPKDAVQVVNWLKKAANKNSVIAAYRLGEMYERGEGVPESMTEAVKWYKIAADNGDADAMIALGFAYTDGEGVSVDKEAGYQWLLKAANAGSADGMRYLGDYFAQSDMGNDCVKAVNWYMKAVDAGDSTSVKPVGVITMKGECAGLDKAAIAKWMERYALAHYPDAGFYMGGFYIVGVGVPKDPEAGMNMLISDRENGKFGVVQRNFSTNNLFTLYNSGSLDAAQQKRLLKWFETYSVKTNDDEMMAVVANIYINKETASGNDYRAGLDWAMKSADKGNRVGCFWVGFVYAKGLGDVKRNDEKAFSWLLKAAQKGDKDAMKMVSSFYETGTGTERNLAKAKEWKVRSEQEEE
jgi:TPR repeat protein